MSLLEVVVSVFVGWVVEDTEGGGGTAGLTAATVLLGRGGHVEVLGNLKAKK